jgi:hypothetical protein
MHRRIAELFLFCDEDAIDVPTKNSDNFSFKFHFYSILLLQTYLIA